MLLGSVHPFESFAHGVVIGWVPHSLDPTNVRSRVLGNQFPIRDLIINGVLRPEDNTYPFR